MKLVSVVFRMLNIQHSNVKDICITVFRDEVWSVYISVVVETAASTLTPWHLMFYIYIYMEYMESQGLWTTQGEMEEGVMMMRNDTLCTCHTLYMGVRNKTTFIFDSALYIHIYKKVRFCHYSVHTYQVTLTGMGMYEWQWLPKTLPCYKADRPMLHLVLQPWPLAIKSYL